MDPEHPSHPPQPDEPGQGSALPSSPAPARVLELAAACVRFVLSTFKIELDFTRETLPLLDHYLEQARSAVRARPETLPLVAGAAGAYLGEVARRGHRCWWRVSASSPLDWRLEFGDVFLSFEPMRVVEATLMRSRPEPEANQRPSAAEEQNEEDMPLGVRDSEPPDPDLEEAQQEPEPDGDSRASLLPEEADPNAALDPGFFMADEDREEVARRLDRLPLVSDQEYWAPSTRLEVVDIVVDAIASNLLANPLRRRSFGPEDYDPDMA